MPRFFYVQMERKNLKKEIYQSKYQNSFYKIARELIIVCMKKIDIIQSEEFDEVKMKIVFYLHIVACKIYKVFLLITNFNMGKQKLLSLVSYHFQTLMS